MKLYIYNRVKLSLLSYFNKRTIVTLESPKEALRHRNKDYNILIADNYLIL